MVVVAKLLASSLPFEEAIEVVDSFDVVDSSDTFDSFGAVVSLDIL